MSTKASSCMYYMDAITVKETYCKDGKISACKCLLGTKCPDFYLREQYKKDLKLKEKNSYDIPFMKEKIEAYKNKYNLSNLDIGLDAGVSQGTIWNLLNDKKLKLYSLQRINKFVQTIR